MQSSKYIFCGYSVELQCEEYIHPEAEFSKFMSDFSNADYKIRVIRADSLPPKDGELIFSSDRRKIYSGDKTKAYTTYFDVKLHQYVDYACKVDNSELYISYPDEMREVTIFESIDLPSMLLEKGVGIIHCSFIEYNGKAILFVGDKQVGKSTQASLWNEFADAEIINGDRAAVYFEDGVLYADGIPFCGTSKICKNKKLPVKALVCLSKGPENKIKKLSAIESFMRIIGKFTYNKTKEYTDLVSQIVGQIVENTPVYDYSCLKDKSAVTFLKDELWKE